MTGAGERPGGSRRGGAAAALLVALLGSRAAVPAEPWTLLRVRAFGSQRFAESDIVRASGLEPGTRVTLESFEKATERLSRLGTFEQVTYRYSQDGSNAIVQIHVRDAGDFLPCRFENFVWFADDEIEAALAGRVPLFAGEVAAAGSQQDEVAAALAAILKARRLPGTVGRIVTSDAASGPRLGFRVEGVPITIGRVDLAGFRHADAETVRRATAPLVGRAYARTPVEAFLAESLAPLWSEIGCLRAQFAEPSAEVLASGPDGVSVAVLVRVREGKRYAFAGVEFAGAAVFPADDLAGRVGLVRGEPANGVRLARDLEAIRAAYLERGYLHAVLHESRVFDEKASTVRYAIEVREGDRFRMGRLEIVGLPRRHAERLKKLWKLAPGDPFDAGCWEAFRAESGSRLPASRSGWVSEREYEIRDADRTVDVTIRFSEKRAD